MATDGTPRRRRRRGRTKVDTAPPAEAVPVEPAESPPATNGRADAAEPEPETEEPRVPEPATEAAEAEPETQERPETEPDAGAAEPEAEPAAEAAQPAPETEEPPAAGAAEPEAEPAAEAAEPEPAPAAVAVAPPAEPAPAAAEAPAPTRYERWWATGLPNVGTIARRELAAFFVSPIGYVVVALVMLPVSLFGYLLPVFNGEPVLMDGVFGVLAFLMAFFVPLYTMRLLAEERRSGTLEMLLTSPVRDWELVVGKWLGGFVFFLVTIAFTLVFVLLLSVYTQLHSPASILGIHLTLPAVDYGAILTGYVGIILLGAAWVAIGLLASSLTSNQIIAAVLGIVVLFAFQFAFDRVAAGFSAPVGDLFDYLSAFNRLHAFIQGQIMLRDVLYFVSLTVGALFIATRVVESRKWR